MSGADVQKPPLQAWLLANLAFSLMGRASVLQLAANGAAGMFIVGVLGWIGITLGRIDIPGMPWLGWAYIWPSAIIAAIAIVLHAVFTRLAVSLLLSGPTSFRTAVKASLPVLPPMFAIAVLTGLPVLALAGLLVVPGLWLLARVATAPASLLADEVGPIDAIRRAFTLSDGFAWQILTPWTVVVLAWLCLQFAIYGLLMKSDIWALGALVHAASFVLLLAWQAIYFVLVFLKLRVVDA